MGEIRKQRNSVTSLKRKSRQCYFDGKCNGQTSKNGKDFWNAIRPYLTNNSNSQSRITLSENGHIVSNPSDVCNIFNDFFINIAQDMSEPENIQNLPIEQLCNHYESHPSIRMIESHMVEFPTFSFSHVTQDQVYKKIMMLKTNKACGHDQLPARLIKLGAPILSRTLTQIFNLCFDNSIFPC